MTRQVMLLIQPTFICFSHVIEHDFKYHPIRDAFYSLFFKTKYRLITWIRVVLQSITIADTAKYQMLRQKTLMKTQMKRKKAFLLKICSISFSLCQARCIFQKRKLRLESRFGRLCFSQNISWSIYEKKKKKTLPSARKSQMVSYWRFVWTKKRRTYIICENTILG